MTNKTKTLRDYVAHRRTCPLAVDEMGDYYIQGLGGRENRSCLCGLAALLAEPQPNLSAAVQTLETLVEKWRDRAAMGRGLSADVREDCADELESALKPFQGK